MNLKLLISFHGQQVMSLAISIAIARERVYHDHKLNHVCHWYAYASGHLGRTRITVCFICASGIAIVCAMCGLLSGMSDGVHPDHHR